LYPRIRILDASTEEYQEEEEVYFQGEEDHFDHLNQGKLYYCKLTPLQANILAKCKALQEQGTTTFYFMIMTLFPSFTLQALFTFVLSKYFLIYDSLG
jgi:hypothetical protein